MNTQQLIEMAVLDALALLDDDERIDFERSFVAATTDVQSHVRREQTRLCNIETILPNVEPPAGLRAAVLAAVRGEIELQAGAADDLLPSRRVSPLWRAATVGLATAAVVLGGSYVMLSQEIGKINENIDKLNTVDAVQSELGRTYANAFISRDFEKVAFEPVNAGFVGEFTMLVDPESSKILLTCKDLPDQGSYTLVFVDNRGVATELAQFTSNGVGIQYPETKAQVTLAPGCSIILTASDSNGRAQTVLRTPDDFYSKLL